MRGKQRRRHPLKLLTSPQTHFTVTKTEVK